MRRLRRGLRCQKNISGHRNLFDSLASVAGSLIIMYAPPGPNPISAGRSGVTMKPWFDSRTCAPVAAVGYVWFLVSASVIQGLRFRDAAAAPISTFLHGPDSAWMQGAYYVLAGALALLGLRFGGRRGERHAACSLALGVAAIAVVLVAYAYSPWPLPGGSGHTLRVRVHVASAFTAFLTVTIAMICGTPLLWKGTKRTLVLAYAGVVLAVEVLAALATTYLQGAYGVLEKLSVAGLVIWLLAAALASWIPCAVTDESPGLHDLSRRGG